MPRYAPRTQLETHEVANQPRPLVDVNLYETDLALREAARGQGGAWVDAPLSALGAEAGSEAVLELGELANRFPPELTVFDRYGRRIDEAKFHPSYHQLMDVAMRHGIHDIAWRSDEAGGHVAHAAMLALFTQAEAGTMCPISMTYAAVPALRCQPDVTQPWLDRIIGGAYDAPLRPIAEKRGVTVGMAMTEKQGGSDVRANATRATPIGDGLYRLLGHKWFCSAPMSDGFLTLAYAEGGLTCFLVPRIAPDGSRNGIQVMRLKDKLGNKSNASSEIEYHDAVAWRLGEEGRGVSVIIDMVHHTRLDTMAGTLGIMRRPLAEAVNHVMGRRAFQKTLIDQAAMRSVIADLALEYEAAALMTMRVARAFDGVTESDRAFARLAVALGKYWLTKRCPNFVY
ncbi:MAG TPA: acyl-CoA dehydrogenase family protein, partial [Caulobacter sp.]|nr:acyl-CoA dehydrogenase family protein [Caulobacter sp.]